MTLIAYATLLVFFLALIAAIGCTSPARLARPRPPRKPARLIGQAGRDRTTARILLLCAVWVTVTSAAGVAPTRLRTSGYDSDDWVHLALAERAATHPLDTGVFADVGRVQLTETRPGPWHRVVGAIGYMTGIPAPWLAIPAAAVGVAVLFAGIWLFGRRRLGLSPVGVGVLGWLMLFGWGLGWPFSGCLVAGNLPLIAFYPSTLAAGLWLCLVGGFDLLDTRIRDAVVVAAVCVLCPLHPATALFAGPCLFAWSVLERRWGLASALFAGALLSALAFGDYIAGLSGAVAYRSTAAQAFYCSPLEFALRAGPPVVLGIVALATAGRPTRIGAWAAITLAVWGFGAPDSQALARLVLGAIFALHCATAVWVDSWRDISRLGWAVLIVVALAAPAIQGEQQKRWTSQGPPNTEAWTQQAAETVAR